MGVTVFSRPTLTSVPGFCSPVILSGLLSCIYFKPAALDNTGLRFSTTINGEAHRDTQVPATKEITLVIRLLCTVCVLFSDTLANDVFVNAHWSLPEGKVNGLFFI